MAKTVTMRELADRITAHLRRFEADPKINKPQLTPDDGRGGRLRLQPYFNAGAFYAGGPRLGVRYISYQGHSQLGKAAAIEYLAWLDAGNVGTHHKQQRGR